ncbi:MAG: DUF4132 domain-containing protein [Phycisphaerales bacterium]|nr:DUF4132 domain-containing protein [Phycisphaerales bacterium]
MLISQALSGSERTYAPFDHSEAGWSFLKLDSRHALMACFERYAWLTLLYDYGHEQLRDSVYSFIAGLTNAFDRLARRSIPLTDADLDAIATVLPATPSPLLFGAPIGAVLSQCEYVLNIRAIPPALLDALRGILLKTLVNNPYSTRYTEDLGVVIVRNTRCLSMGGGASAPPMTSSRAEAAAKELFGMLLGPDSVRLRWRRGDPDLLRFLSAPQQVQRVLLHEAMLLSGNRNSPDGGPPTSRWEASTEEDVARIAALVASILLLGRLELTPDELCHCAEQIARYENVILHTSRSFEEVVDRLEGLVAAQPGFDRALAAAASLAATIGRDSTAPYQRLARRLRAIGGTSLQSLIEPGEAWADAALGDLTAMDGPRSASWMQLLEHCATARGSGPSSRWIRSAESLRGGVGRPIYIGVVSRWFDLVDKPRTREASDRHPWSLDPTNLIDDDHADILKGLCWIASTIESPDLARALGRLATSCYRKVPGVGPRAVKIGNAAVYALGRMPGRDSLGQLAMLRVKVKFGSAQKLLESALNAAAEREGLPREEIEELAVPGYGMGEVGLRRETLGDYTAELRITGAAQPVLAFLKPDGKPQKSVPAAIKETHADDLKELKSAAKDIGAMLPAQRDRIDGLFLEDKSWDLPTWCERYLDHPLVGVIARRLIWRFAPGKAGVWDAAAPARSAMWLDGAGLVGLDGKPVTPDKSIARVRLWHPIEAEQAEVLAWREFVERHQIVQPFKQAHREVYLLTDAERATGTYSNRYAAHILRQHQFNALCAARGWKNKLRLLVDDEFPPASRTLPVWDLRAEFWVEGAGDEHEQDTNDVGVFNYLVTDQVRFYNPGAATNTAHASGGSYAMRAAPDAANEPLPLDRIPPLVFSEIMRDVDLFVGVASVGNNPAWQDGGPEGHYRDYWWGYSFGDLGATAQTRRALLERLVPKLKIANRCALAGNFLTVRGDIRTYKIHLGSGNILMEPDDQYLCIVPGRSGPTVPQDLYLPFEGDRTLAIILSKAFLLADDRSIEDPTITRQLGRH